MFLVSLVVLGMAASAVSRRSEVPFGIVTPKPSEDREPELGTFVNLMVTGCTIQPCSMTVGNYYEISPIFRPVRLTNTLVIYIWMYVISGEAHLLPITQIPGTYEAGKEYKIFYEALIPSFVRGKSGNIRVILDDSTNVFVSRRFNVSIAA